MKMKVLLLSLLSTIWFSEAFGQEADDDRCKEIKATLATTLVTENCPSPVHLCAAGLITRDELISGRTFVSVLGVAPSIGLPGIESPTSVSLAGQRSITTSHGTLFFRLITVFDTLRGEFAEIDRVTGGTGKFEGATGTLWLTGTGTTVFEGKAAGQICRSRS
jgi:hypothetical protein